MNALTVIASLCGSGGIVIWFLGRVAKKMDEKDEIRKDIREMKEMLKTLEDGLIMALENDKVIFAALRTHEINGESEEQEKKMDAFFLSLL